ncbi:MAG: NAD-dependent epimerase/dehydratase family protein, partial [Candidatus Limnocylindria bacterium]
MKTVVTGGAGFIGSALVRHLRARGDEVIAFVRSAAQSAPLRELGCVLVEADLAATPIDRLAEAMDGAVLDAAIAAGVARIVYASTANVYGDTHGRVVDETYRRPQPPVYLSYYDETKYLAHLAAEEAIASGAGVL